MPKIYIEYANGESHDLHHFDVTEHDDGTLSYRAHWSKFELRLDPEHDAIYEVSDEEFEQLTEFRKKAREYQVLLDEVYSRDEVYGRE